jgi:hypothetical protein
MSQQPAAKSPPGPAARHVDTAPRATAARDIRCSVTAPTAVSIRPRSFDIAPWADRVQLIDAEYVGPWELPVLGAVTAPSAVLIRPDGYVAWVGEPADPGLPDALTTWFGPPTEA